MVKLRLLTCSKNPIDTAKDYKVAVFLNQFKTILKGFLITHRKGPIRFELRTI